MKKRIAFVTNSGHPALIDEDLLVVPYLEKKGITVQAAAWDDPTVNWKQFDAIIMRSAWNYHLKNIKFQMWLSMVEESKIAMWNKVSTIHWNTNKSYLFSLESSGISIVPSLLCNRLDLPTIAAIKKWKTIVIKPSVGAESSGVRKFRSSNLLLWIPYAFFLLRKDPIIIQQFMENITEGEYSLIFFNKKFSHAVIKVPKSGEFRTQQLYGGTKKQITVSENFIKQAADVLQARSESFLYARVDCIEKNGKLYLMELEVSEPYLFLNTDSKAPERFANAIYAQL